MKHVVFIGLLAAAPLCGRAASDIGQLPEDKKPTEVRADERNPFGKRIVKTAEPAVVETETEETKIRAVIDKLPLEGITEGFSDTKALLGSFVLAVGKPVPPVLADQSERLVVLSVTPNELQLGFIEKDGTSETRKIVRKLDLQPTVRFKLPGPPEAAKNEGAGLGGMTKKDETETSTK